MASKIEEIADLCKAAIEAMNLTGVDDEAIPVFYMDVPIVYKEDTLPRILVSPGKDPQGSYLGSTHDTIVTYPIQITFVDESNRDEERGKGKIQQEKERLRLTFDTVQPWAINPDGLFRIDIRGAAPLDRKGWMLNYDVQTFFVMVQIDHRAEFTAPP